MHVAHPQQGHKARAEGAAVAVESRVPLPAHRKERSGEAGYRDAALPHGDFRQRVLLAWTQGAAGSRTN